MEKQWFLPEITILLFSCIYLLFLGIIIISQFFPLWTLIYCVTLGKIPFLPNTHET